MSTTKIIRIAIIGDSAVGKTQIFRSFFSMPLDLRSTLEPVVQNFVVDELAIQLWDLPGNHDVYDFYGSIWLGNLSIAIIIYSIDNIQSLRSLPFWFNLLLRYTGIIPTLFIANKTDLLQTPIAMGKEHLIEEGKRFVDEVAKIQKTVSIAFMDVSAINPKTSWRVFNRAFQLIEEKPGTSEAIQSSESENHDSAKLLYDERVNRLKEIINNVISEMMKNNITISASIIKNYIYLLENDRHIRESLERINIDDIKQTFILANQDNRWVDKPENLLYLLLFVELSSAFHRWMPVGDEQTLSQKLATFFSKDVQSLDRWRDLTQEDQIEIVKNLGSSLDDFADKIYFKYREIVYEK